MITASLTADIGQLVIELDDRLGFTPEQIDAVHELCAIAYRQAFNTVLDATRQNIEQHRADVDNGADCPLCLQHRP